MILLQKEYRTAECGGTHPSVVWHMRLFPALGRRRQVDILSQRPTWATEFIPRQPEATQRNPVFKAKTNQPTKSQESTSGHDTTYLYSQILRGRSKEMQSLSTAEDTQDQASLTNLARPSQTKILKRMVQHSYTGKKKNKLAWGWGSGITAQVGLIRQQSSCLILLSAKIY